MKHWAATLIALLCFFALSAQQRHVTPIDSSEDLRPVTKEELEQMILDKELFIKLFSLFNSMSKRGKYVTIETLIMNLLEEE